MRLTSAGVLPISSNIEHEFAHVKIISGETLGFMLGSGWTTPRQGIAAECQRRGQEAVVSGCIDLLAGRDVDDGLILALGGPPAEYVLTGYAGGREGYWPRVSGSGTMTCPESGSQPREPWPRSRPASPEGAYRR
jgi:hypothetical protein